LYRNLSVGWALFDVAHGLAATFLLNRLSVAEYAVWSRLLLWPFTGVLLALTAVAIWRAANGMTELRAAGSTS
jgi:hypothetical protein